MRLVLAAVSLLSLAALPVTASADPVDYFTLTGNGNTYTWNLPANETYPDLPHLGLLDFSTAVTLNAGTSTVEDVGFYTVFGPAGPDLFIPDIPDELYGQHVALDFVARIRGQRKFDSVKELITAMGKDTDRARKLLDAS